jgi:hypothetical protein
MSYHMQSFLPDKRSGDGKSRTVFVWSGRNVLEIRRRELENLLRTPDEVSERRAVRVRLSGQWGRTLQGLRNGIGDL